MADRRDFLLGALAAGAGALSLPAGRRQPALFVSHGAAVFTTSPQDATHRFLRGLEGTVAGWRPTAIVVISAHLSGQPVRVTGPGALATIHDHPARDVYGYRYPGRGAEALSGRVRQALALAGIDSDLDGQRGLDHGAWVPLSLLQPHGEVPVAQLSLDARAGAGEHLALGRALAPLRDEGVLLVGSGGVTHNQDVFRQGFFSGADPGVPQPFSREFDAWVSQVLTSRTGAGRSQALGAFEAHPLARRAHPTVEHFLPLLVMAGAAEDEPARKLFEGFQHSLSTSAFQLG
jgi:4,5-DOPA dioxygenase extradiol